MEIKCPKCGSEYLDIYDYELTDESHIILYYSCEKCRDWFEVYCELNLTEIIDKGK